MPADRRDPPAGTAPGFHARIEAEAQAIIQDVIHEPGRRARRIYATYARFYLEDPFIFAWFGLAALVGSQIHNVLNTLATQPLHDMMADGNLRIYRSMAPAALTVKRGRLPEGSLARPFGLLRDADRALLTDPALASCLQAAAIRQISTLEQRDIVQPAYDLLPPPLLPLVTETFSFRLGYDSTAPVMRFKGTDPADPRQRLHFTLNEILPAFDRRLREDPEWVRADIARLWREDQVG